MNTFTFPEFDPKHDIEAALSQLPADQQAKIRKALEKDASKRTSETELLSKYPQVIEGTLVWDEAAKKQAVQIRCTAPDCRETRRVYTSDLFQVSLCLEHKKIEKKESNKAMKVLIAELKKQQQS